MYWQLKVRMIDPEGLLEPAAKYSAAAGGAAVGLLLVFG
jgi:hypothetical protein